MTDPLAVAARVDAHHHFWDLSSGRHDWPTEAEGPIFRSLGPADLAPEIRAAGIDRTVLVQTTDSTEDTDSMLDAAASHAFIGGVVGWVPLGDRARLEADGWPGDGGLRPEPRPCRDGHRVTSVREPPLTLDAPLGNIQVVGVLGSFVRSHSAQEDPVHALIGRFRAGEAAAFAEVLRAGLAALDSDETPHGPQIAALVVPGHDGTRQAGLVRLVAGLALSAGWTVADPSRLIRHTPVGEAKRRQPRDPAAELVSLRAAPATLPGTIETILLVDDVLASGGTIRACVAALRRDGWQGGVAALVLARAC